MHTGDWPHPSWTEWLQWTASPPNVVDLDGDGKNEVLGVPNVEMHEPYETQAYAFMVLEGAYGDGSRSAMRKAGWETLPRGDAPIAVDGWYPPSGVPGCGDRRPPRRRAARDRRVARTTATSTPSTPTRPQLWRFDYTHGKPIMYASEPVVADLEPGRLRRRSLFSTSGHPTTIDSGHLVDPRRERHACSHDVPLAEPGRERQRQRRPGRARRRRPRRRRRRSRSSSRPSTTASTSSRVPGSGDQLRALAHRARRTAAHGPPERRLVRASYRRGLFARAGSRGTASQIAPSELSP